MSVQFGRWNFNGEPTDPLYIKEVGPLLSAYAPDGLTVEIADSFALVYGAFHTTNKFSIKLQPYRTARGDWIMWDGRLDNRSDCASDLGVLSSATSDVELVAGLYERWGFDAFTRLLGDWSVSIWDPAARRLVLAKDFLGARHLYYSPSENCVAWSTILDPLVLLRDRPFAVCEEYAAGWLSAFPRGSLTPYEGILSVPAAHYVVIRNDQISEHQFWRFDPEKRTHLRTDREYEEQFLTEFQKSVSRRMRAPGPLLAELSGGIDSSSIVCTADNLRSNPEMDLPRLDTVSYFNDAEPNWDERPYFTQVENQRGRTGFHIEVGAPEPFLTATNNHFLATPSAGDPASGFAKKFSECIASGPYRVVLSGVGGDEVAGGIPTPLPELANHLVRFELVRFARRLIEWSIAKRKPVFHLLFHTLNSFLPHFEKGQLSWLSPDFARRNRKALVGYQERTRLRGGLPSFQANMSALDALRRQLSCTPLPIGPVYEKRYPYLDRDFLTFCYSVPREQFVRPHERRSLMRRAMAGIVPDGILHRRRKGQVVRQLIRTFSEACDTLASNPDPLLIASLGIADREHFLRTVEETRKGNGSPLVPMLRAIALEQWLRTLAECSVISRPRPVSRVGTNGNTQAPNHDILGREQSNRKGGEQHEIQQT